ncbi:hypothetical protein NGC53_06845 [Aerococcus viridans]|nr:hypothetical protein [Aerococcus viridans]MEB7389515.1 hypothetical protein [Aerococcus viridans]
MGIENRKSTELEDLFASIVNIDGDGDKDKNQDDRKNESENDKSRDDNK